MRRLTCNPKGFWSAWQREVLGLQDDWRLSAKELVLQAQLKCSTGVHAVQVLVDTGAKIPLVFRNGLIPLKALKKASFPVHFSTADGHDMEGGTRGLFMEMRLPAISKGRLVVARTVPLFAYEADIHGVDVIIGYPFLKVFNLVVDTINDNLVLGSSFPKPQLTESSSMKVERALSVSPTNISTPKVTAVSIPSAVSERVAADHTPSDNELRCLLFCKKCDEGKDCCRAAHAHRIAHIAVNTDIMPTQPTLVDESKTDAESDSSVGPDQDDHSDDVAVVSFFDDDD